MFELFIKFLIGGLLYMGIEVLYDNTSDRSMGLVGGLAFIICTSVINVFDLHYLINGFIIANIVTILEYIGGRLFNKDFHIWDYRNMPFNFKGQVCLPFYLIWLLVIAPLIMWLDKIIVL